jgi:hypothetical protein
MWASSVAGVRASIHAARRISVLLIRATLSELPLAYIGNDSRTKRKKGEMSLRGVFD